MTKELIREFLAIREEIQLLDKRMKPLIEVLDQRELTRDELNELQECINTFYLRICRIRVENQRKKRLSERMGVYGISKNMPWDSVNRR